LISNEAFAGSAISQSPRGVAAQNGGSVVLVVELVVVLVVVGVPPTSTAPMSHRAPCGRDAPR
jgi:hypothetical protein